MEIDEAARFLLRRAGALDKATQGRLGDRQRNWGLSSKWTENRGKPERYGEWGTLFFAVITWAAGRDSFSPDHRPGFAAGAVPPWPPPPASQRNGAPACARGSGVTGAPYPLRSPDTLPFGIAPGLPPRKLYLG